MLSFFFPFAQKNILKSIKLNCNYSQNWMEKAHIKPVEALSSFEKNAGEKKDNSPGAIALKATEGV